MIDSTTGKKVSISIGGMAGPYIMIPVSQLTAVRNILDRHNIPYSVDHNTISINGKPADSTINLGRGANVKTIQRLLDQIQ
jgi:hypothetical protein